MSWNTDNLSRVFRELYTNISWMKVIEALGEIEDDVVLDMKGFNVFIGIFNKSKP